MKYVVLRDDDANGLTPPSVLEALYRPFLDRGLRVHLATIPEVCTDARRMDGALEGFLLGDRAGQPGSAPIAENRALIDYLAHEPGYVVVQHGLTHALVDGCFELDRDAPAEIAARLERGAALLSEAGLPRPTTFVAPQDQLSRSSLREVMKRFGVVSTQYLSLRRLSPRLWPRYLLARKLLGRRHMRLGRAALLTHPGCLLSYRKPIAGMLERVLGALASGDVTVLVSHHWEYLHPDGTWNEPFVAVLHELAEHLAKARDVKVVSFDEAAALVH
jgi:hypothetical protein